MFVAVHNIKKIQVKKFQFFPQGTYSIYYSKFKLLVSLTCSIYD